MQSSCHPPKASYVSHYVGDQAFSAAWFNPSLFALFFFSTRSLSSGLPFLVSIAGHVRASAAVFGCRGDTGAGMGLSWKYLWILSVQELLLVQSRVTACEYF